MTASRMTALKFTISFALFSALTVAQGAFVMAHGGLGAGLWLRNPAAWLLAAFPVLGLSRLWRPSLWWLLPAPLLLVASLSGTGQSGVHRWLALGPVLLNAAAFVLPFALASLRPTATAQGRLAQGAALVCVSALLAWQPDRSQLIAFGVAVLIFVWRSYGLRARLAAIIILLAALILCLMRPDPLLPVAHVEGMAALGWSISPLLGVLMTAALALCALSPLWLITQASQRTAALSLSAYFLLSGFAWLYGAYPMPLAGYGVSFVIGWWLGVAPLLAGAERSS